MQHHHRIAYTTVINAPLTTTWKALTDPEQVKQYLFGTQLVTDWKEGSPIRFRGEWEGKAYEDKGVILEYAHERSLAYSYLSSWSGMADEPDNYLEVRYAVKPAPGGTELIIEQSNYDAERAAHSQENWKQVIDGLKAMLGV